MFPLIGALATFAASTAGAGLIDLIISLLFRRGGRRAVGAVGRKALGRAPKTILERGGREFVENPQAATRLLKQKGMRSGQIGATFGGLEVALHALGHRGGGAGPDALAELTRARAFLNPTRVAAGGADDLENMLAMLMQQQGGQPAMGAGLPFS